MTETISPVPEQIDTQQLAQDLVARARAEGVELVGPGGLLAGLTKTVFTKTVLETALEGEMAEHLGYDKHDAAGRNGGNSRNGVRAKTVLTEVRPVEIEVPRDRDGSFEPVIVRKRQRRLAGIDQLVLSLTARGLTTGEIAAHFAEVYGGYGVQGHHLPDHRQGRRGDARVVQPAVRDCRVYPVIFIDAIVLKIRDGQVVNRPIYVVIGVTVNGERDILGLWAGDGSDGSEGAKFWLSVLTEIRNRGVEDVCIAVCDRLKGLKGRPDSITTAWPLAVVQACILHLIRNTFRYASRKDWDAISKDLRPIYTAPTEAAAAARFAEFAEAWGGQYPAIVRLWPAAWDEFIPFLDYDVEIRRVLSSTNAIESINARYRRAVRARGHFPTEQAALKCLYLVTRSLDPTGRGKARWAIRWKPALNAFAITFAGRIVPSGLN